MPVPEPGQPPRYSGAFDCVIKTVKLEGVKGLYKGKIIENGAINLDNFLSMLMSLI